MEKAYKAFEDNMETKIYSLMKIYEIAGAYIEEKIRRICKEIYILKTLEEKGLKNFNKIRSILSISDNNQGNELPKAIFIYLEYQDFSLKEILKYRFETKTPYKENELLCAFKQIIKIFKSFYEECSLVHRDIKIENILFSIKADSYVITDFSEAKFNNNSDSELDEEIIIGTPLYFTPENFAAYLKKDLKNKSSLIENDLYALGIVFLLMKSPLLYEEMTKEALFSALKSLENDQSLSSRLISSMMHENPSKRETYFSLESKLFAINDEKNPERPIIMKIEEYLNLKSKEVKKQAENSLELGLVLILMNQLEKALENLNKAKSLFISIKEELKKALAMFYIGKIYYKLDLIEKAGEEIDPIFEDIKKLLTIEDQNKGLEVLGLYYEKKARWVDAICCYEEKMADIEKKQGPFAMKLAELNDKLGDIYEKMSQNEEACKRWNEAIGILKRNEENEDIINKIYDKIYKFHPSEISEDIESNFSMSIKGRGSTKVAKEDFDNIFKEKKPLSNEIKLLPPIGNELKVPISQIEKVKKSSIFSFGNNEGKTKKTLRFSMGNNEAFIDKNEKNPKVNLILKDLEFEKGLLFINRENFPQNIKNIIRFEQSSEEFIRSCLQKEESLVYQNEFLAIFAKETAFIRKNEMEYDLILELKYENRSKINKINNIYAKFQSDSQGVFLNVQQLKGNELESMKNVSHLVFVKFKALKFEIPVMFFFGKYIKISKF